MSRLSCLIFVLVCLTASTLVAAAPDPWAQPQLTAPPAELPRLQAPFALDGQLREWQGTICLPVRNGADRIAGTEQHKWRGPADLGAELYLAWNEEGLCLAAVVTDDSIINTRDDSLLWMQDCLEMFVDGREPGAFASSSYGKGAFQFFLRPPQPDKPAKLVANQGHDSPQGLRAGGQIVPGGYVAEMLVPWAALPGVRPQVGSHLGFTFMVDDFDKRDDANSSSQQLVMSYHCLKLLSLHPDRLIKWTLVDKLSGGAQSGAAYGADLVLPQMASGRKPLVVIGNLSTPLSRQVGRARVTITDAAGKRVFDQDLKLRAMAAPWQEALQFGPVAVKETPARGWAVLALSLFDKRNQPLGSYQNALLSPGDFEGEVLTRLAKANLRDLAATDPFKGAAYCAVGACLEWAKRAAELQDIGLFLHCYRQVQDRLVLLETGTLPASPSGLDDLLNLTANPEAQVVVEAPTPDFATVLFYWGDLPLVAAEVKQYAGEAGAVAALKQTYTPELTESYDVQTVLGMPAYLKTARWADTPIELAQYDPATMVLLTRRNGRYSYAVPLESLGATAPTSLIILENCPPGTRRAVEERAKACNLAPSAPGDVLPDGAALIAGDVRGEDLATRYRIGPIYLMGRKPGFDGARARDGRRTISTDTPVKSVALRVLELLKAGRPVTVQDVDYLRTELVKGMAPALAAKPLPEGFRLYCGDVHMHSFYSDGDSSPVANALEAIYSNLDFAVMTDHDTLRGAQVARKLCQDSGFALPITIGEEITTATGHFNAYPLTSAVSNALPLFERTRAAHRQGAVIQWNHPGYTNGWEMEQLKWGLQGTALDAWEHVPAQYAPWLAEGKLPPLVGSTDTHDGTFSWPERTVVLAPSTDGCDLAEGIRAGRCLIVSAGEARYLYGGDEMRSWVWAALAEGKGLKAAREQALRAVLQKGNLAGLLRSSPPAMLPTK